MAEWYYQGPAGKRMGPVSADELRKLAAAGRIRPDDLVWHEGLTEWAAARGVKGLFNEPHVAKPSDRALPTFLQRMKPTFLQRMKGLLTKLAPKSGIGQAKRQRILVSVMLSVLVAVASLSVVLQVCILRTLTGIASNPMLSVGSAKSTARGKHRLWSIPVRITNHQLGVDVQNYRLDVNVENTELDVNVTNRELDVNVENTHPIPVRID